MDKIQLISNLFYVLLVTKISFIYTFDDFLTNSLENDLSVIPKHYYEWKCQCWNATSYVMDFESECVCYGQTLQRIPLRLHRNLYRLTIADAGIRILRKDSFQPYKESLKDVTITGHPWIFMTKFGKCKSIPLVFPIPICLKTLSNLPKLSIIETGSFRSLESLRSIYITHCPQLKQMDGLFKGFMSDNFKLLRIMKSGLEKIPDLSPLYHSENIIQMIDLEGNEIKEITSNAIQIKAEQIILNFNEITIIDNYAFNNSEIGKLSLKGNENLQILKPNAFSGIINIRELDMSETHINELPVDGLQSLEHLRVQNTPSLKVIPSIYDLKSLKEAWLTYSFHCCAFKYPERHDPTKHKNYELYLKHIRDSCSDDSIVRHVDKREIYQKKNIKFHRKKPSIYAENILPMNEYWGAPLSNNPNESANIFDGFQSDEAKSNFGLGNVGIFHPSTEVLVNNNIIMCGNLSTRFDVVCYPEPDELNPCEDIMGSYWLRISVWFVLTTAIIGNLAVVIVLFSSFSELTVPKFLMCHLAIADLCMGIYLILLACMDLHSMGEYFNYAYDWQNGMGCQVAGFLTMLSSQLSVYTLSVITLERWFAITHAIYLNRRIKLSMAAHIMVVGWAYSILMAALPLFGISNYSPTSICLPMQSRGIIDMIYLLTLIVVTGVAFILIVVCYIQIYFSLDTGTRSSNGHCGTAMEMTVARKMALLVFTDFACWAPIAFFSLTALLGFPLIDVTRSKILLVFFYPLNSCANPYLYALLTTQYKRDLYNLLSRFGICRKKAHRYKLTYSLPTTNNSNPIPLTVRVSIPCSTGETISSRKQSKPINEICV